MFFTSKIIETSIKNLTVIHPFWGITFLACKRKKLPLEKPAKISLDVIIKEFIDKIHKINPSSPLYYQPFCLNSRDQRWINLHDLVTELQSVNTQKFKDVFLYDNKTDKWLGWKIDYVKQLSSQLRGKRISMIDLAIWVFKNKKWKRTTTLNDILVTFEKEFNITDDEKNFLFSTDLDTFKKLKLIFQTDKSDYNQFIPFPDTDSVRRLHSVEYDNQFIYYHNNDSFEHRTILSFLSLTNVGPVSHIELQAGHRLNIITGDNGLGKTFVMESIWRAMTGYWLANSAYPKDTKKESKISYCFLKNGKPTLSKKNIEYDTHSGTWVEDIPIKYNDVKQSLMQGMIVYARVDGSYATYDSAIPIDIIEKQKRLFSFDDVLNGVTGTMEGLIRDWVKWQMDTKKYPFEILVNVLKKISPPDMGELRPGKPVRLPKEPREIPTIIHPYGEIPIVHVSAGVKRIVSLAYLIVLAWYEHKENAKVYNKSIGNQMMIIIDEIEAHLHPKWQRTILPALLEIQKYLSDELEIQFFVSTHSPIVLASIETYFDQKTDRIFHLKQNFQQDYSKQDISNRGQISEIELSEEIFQKNGQISSWLLSPIFELKHARSKEAEVAIEKAKFLQLQDSPSNKEVQKVHEELLRCLSETDSFWHRWIFFAEKHGVKI